MGKKKLDKPKHKRDNSLAENSEDARLRELEMSTEKKEPEPVGKLVRSVFRFEKYASAMVVMSDARKDGWDHNPDKLPENAGKMRVRARHDGSFDLVVWNRSAAKLVERSGGGLRLAVK